MARTSCHASAWLGLINTDRIPPGVAAHVEHLLARCTFPPAGSPLACAVSGGADSTTLLVLAIAAGCDVTAHHVDHGLRPGSAAEADVVAALADRFGSRFVAHTVHVEPGGNLEARARQARAAVLPADVATGHTLDDRAETMLINLVRGAGRRGMAPLIDQRRHPIVALRRAETVDLVARLGIEPVNDPSNTDPRHQRNRIRADVLPLLDDVAKRDVAVVIARQATLWADEDELLDRLATELDPTDAVAIAAAPPPLARRALRAWIDAEWSSAHPPSAASIERVLEVARGTAVSTEIEGGHRVYRRNQCLRLEAPSLG